jgi:integrase
MKRAKGEGSAKKLPSGMFQPRKTVAGVEITGPQQKTKTAALRIAAKLKPPEPARPPDHSGLNIVGFWEQMLDGPYLSGLSENRYAFSDTVLNMHVKGTLLATLPLSAIETKDVQEWMAELRPSPRLRKDGTAYGRKALSASTKRDYLFALSAVLTQAVRQGIIKANPAEHVLKPKVMEPPKKLLRPADVPKLLALLTGEAKLIAALALHGLTRSEITGLRWADYDGERLQIRSQVIAPMGPKRESSQLKRQRRYRDVFLAQWAKDILTEAGTSGYILGGENHYSPFYVSRMFVTALKKTPFAWVRLHLLRSTFAMLMLENKVDIRTAAEILGNDPAVLARNYARSHPDIKKAAVLGLFPEHNGQDTGQKAEK